LIIDRLRGIAPTLPARALARAAWEACWHNGQAWGAVQASLCWVAFLFFLIAVALALRTKR
jgi:hypothetical protein